MSEPKTIQDVVMQSIQAEDSGCIIDWKQTTLQLVQAAQQQFASMEQKINELEQECADAGLRIANPEESTGAE